MNIRKLSDKDLINLINTTINIDLLEAAEEEFVRRHSDGSDAWNEAIDEEAILKEINKCWRPS